MKLTLLGTGNALVTECYNTCFVLSEGEKHFMIDAGGGNTVLRQLKRAGIDVNAIHDLFLTHKHVDHFMGIIWMIRVICQNMQKGVYHGEARIYGHAEVIEQVHQVAHMLLGKKQTKYIGDRVHLIAVADGETREIQGNAVTFFDIQSTKAKQFGFSMEYAEGKKLTCCGDEPYNECEQKYAQNSTCIGTVKKTMHRTVIGCCTRRFVWMHRRIFFIRMKRAIPRQRMPARRQKSWV